MRTVVARVAGLLAVALALGGCTDGGEGAPTPTGDGTRASASPTRDPAAVVSAAVDATTAAKSVVVGRTTRDGDDWLQEEIEVSFAAPPSARVLHVGEDIWTLDVVDGVGYLKDQSERKSTNRWRRLSDTDTAAYLQELTPQSLLVALDAATSVAEPAEETVREVPSTCHAFVLDPAKAVASDADEPDAGATTGTSAPASASARLCVDNGSRPVELVVTVGERVTTSVFSQWGLALEAQPPPAHLVDDSGD